MPAASNKQRMAACLALAAKKGKKRSGELKSSAKKMYDNMTISELEDFCKPEPRK